MTQPPRRSKFMMPKKKFTLEHILIDTPDYMYWKNIFQNKRWQTFNICSNSLQLH